MHDLDQDGEKNHEIVIVANKLIELKKKQSWTKSKYEIDKDK